MSPDSPDLLDRVRQLRAATAYTAAREAARAGAASAGGGSRSVQLLIELGRLEEEFADYAAAGLVLARAAELARHVPDAEEAGVWRARALVGLAAVRRAEARPQDADPLLAEALELIGGHAGAAPGAVVEILVEAGARRAEQADHAAAQALFERAVAAADGSPAGRQRDDARARALAALAGSFRMQGRFAEAEPLFRRALELGESTFGDHSIEVAGICNDLAITFKFSGRFADAKPLYRRALGILSAAYGTEEHPDAASIYHNLGGLAHAAGDYAAAEAPAQRAVEIREATLGADHVHSAADRSALGSILDALGRTEEAEPLFRQALAAFERHYGADHYEVAVVLNNLGAIERRRGNLDEAESLYRRALAIKERLLGEDSPETGFTLNNLALVCRATGRPGEADALYRRALHTFEQGLEPTHPATAKARANLARLLRAGGRETEAAGLETS
ncbi:MAG: tetratricopeptide repeat protein [Solirubrobacterales bacterium]